MATKDFGTNDDSTVKVWSKVLTREAFAETFIQRFMGEDRRSLLWIKDDLTKGAGDRIRIPLRLLMDGEGVTEDEILEGREESLRFSTDDLLINELAHATRWKGKMSEQRVIYDMREEGMSGLATWHAERFDDSFFNQLCGNTGTTTKKAGNNAALAPTATSGNTRILIGNLGEGANRPALEASLSSTASQGFQLPTLNELTRIAKTARPLIRPLRVDGVDRYVLFLSPGQAFQLQTDIEATTTRIKWQDIHTAAMQGGQVSNNPLFTGAIGMYNNIIMHEATRLPAPPTNAAAVRAVMCGAQAGAMGFGRETPGLSRLDWHEESFDHGRQHSIKSGSLYGVKKLQFENRAGVTVDYSTIVATTMETK